MISNYAEITENSLEKIIFTDDIDLKTIYDSMRYSVLNGGKRIRPLLVYQFYRAVSGKDDISPAIKYASAVEMIHSASLIHDDLPALDNDDLRRGKPSNHKVYGEAPALIAADGLFIDAFSVIASNEECSYEQNCRAVNVLAKKTGSAGMCGGQMIDIESEGKTVNCELLKKMDLLKTSCLISASCMLGVIAAGGSEELVDAAEEYGRYIGLAFQIKDDIIDIEGEASVIGKTPGKDKNSNKSTYPSLYGVDECKKMCNIYTEEAKKALEAFPYKNAVKELSELADQLNSRKK